MFENFPKKRIELPEAYIRIYEEHYLNNRYGKTKASALTSWMERWLHKKVAADVKSSILKSTLEIGAGNLNQLDFETAGKYDIIEPNAFLYNQSVHIDKINNIYSSIELVEKQNKYDRITSIATFEHVEDLPSIVATSCLLLEKNGCFRVSIPNEGTICWKLGWMLTSAIEYRIKYGLDYSLLLQYEHINTAQEIEEVLRFFYKDIKIANFGISKHFACYRFFECKNPNVEIAEQFLNAKK